MSRAVLYVNKSDVPSGGVNEIDLSLSKLVVTAYGANVISSYLSIRFFGWFLETKKHCGSIWSEHDGTPWRNDLIWQRPDIVD